MEKAVLKEKERLKDEARKQKRLETNFKELLKIKFTSLTDQSKWENLKDQIENNEEYLAISSELDRIRLFDEYHRQVITDVQQSHHHKRTKKDKKKRKHEKIKSNVNFNYQISIISETFFFRLIGIRE
jgi:pre-mRNA-processing factor 40